MPILATYSVHFALPSGTVAGELPVTHVDKPTAKDLIDEATQELTQEGVKLVRNSKGICNGELKITMSLQACGLGF